MKSLVTLVALLAAVAVPVVAAPGERSATLRGSWRVGPVVDPTHHALPADVAAQLAHAHLPSPGEVVRAEPGKLCIGSSGCNEVTWTEVKLADFEYGPRYKLDFDLSPQTSVYQATTGDRFRTYTLVSRPDRKLMAVVILCQDSYRARGCHNAYQVWSPANAAARMTVSGSRRSGRN
jgi:hypothetical protein